MKGSATNIFKNLFKNIIIYHNNKVFNEKKNEGKNK